MLGWGEGSSSGKSAFPDDQSRRSPISRYEMTGESQLPFVPFGDLQTEAGAVFRMKSGLAGGRFPQRMEAWRVGACVVGSLHVRPGRSLRRVPGPRLLPRPRPQHPSGRAEPGGRKEAGPRSWPRLGSLQLGLGEGTSAHRLPIGARVRATRPHWAMRFGHEIQRF